MQSIPRSQPMNAGGLKTACRFYHRRVMRVAVIVRSMTLIGGTCFAAANFKSRSGGRFDFLFIQLALEQLEWRCFSFRDRFRPLLKPRDVSLQPPSFHPDKFRGRGDHPPLEASIHLRLAGNKEALGMQEHHAFRASFRRSACRLLVMPVLIHQVPGPRDVFSCDKPSLFTEGLCPRRPKSDLV